jgi:spermidine/putrescine transport system permease protein
MTQFSRDPKGNSRSEQNNWASVFFGWLANRSGLVAVHPFIQSVFYLVPISLLIGVSFWTTANFQLVSDFTFDNYRSVLTNSLHLRAFGVTLRIGFVSASVAVVLAVPMACAMVFHMPPNLRRIGIFALLLPFLSSLTIRTFSWQLWFTDTGIVRSILLWLGFPKYEHGLIYTPIAVHVGQLSVLIPLATVFVYLSVSLVESTHLRAAQNLGASRLQLFLHIVLPSALPGCVLAFFFGLIWSFGDYICPSVLGGNQETVVSVLLIEEIRVFDLPKAAVLGNLLLVACLGAVLILFRVTRVLPTSQHQEKRT